MTKVTISAAVRATGHARMTIERWIDNGWLPVEEFGDGRGKRVLINLDDIEAARQTAERAPRHPARVWLEYRTGGYVRIPIPAEGTWQRDQLGTWVRRNWALFDA